MKTYIKNRFYIVSLFFCLIFVFPSLSQAGDVKYFLQSGCTKYFEFDTKCNYVEEINENQLADTGDYYKVHYDNEQLTHAFRISNEDNKATVHSEFIYDSKERLTLYEVFLDDYPLFENYELCKISYGTQVKESRCYDKKGKLQYKTISHFENNLLLKSDGYDGSGNLKEYSTFDHETWTEKSFTPDGKLKEERSMHWYAS